MYKPRVNVLVSNATNTMVRQGPLKVDGSPKADELASRGYVEAQIGASDGIRLTCLTGGGRGNTRYVQECEQTTLRTLTYSAEINVRRSG